MKISKMQARVNSKTGIYNRIADMRGRIALRIGPLPFLLPTYKVLKERPAGGPFFIDMDFTKLEERVLAYVQSSK